MKTVLACVIACCSRGHGVRGPEQQRCIVKMGGSVV